MRWVDRILSPVLRSPYKFLLPQLLPARYSSMMLNTAISVSRRRISSTIGARAVRAHATKADTPAKGPIGEDGRHEIWREGIYDHDNEPK